MKTDYEIIEKYLSGELSDNDIIDFTEKLKTDSDFKKEFELYREINKSLTNKYSNLEKEKNLKNTLDSLGKEHFQNNDTTETKGNKSISIKKYLLRISSIAAIVIIGFFMLKPQQSLYDQYANHSKLEIQVKGENENILLKASEFYNNNNYSNAIPLFEKYLIENPHDSEIQMSLGISLLEENKFKEALLVFNYVLKQNNIFKNKVNWYLALTYIKNKENAKAKAYLKNISKDSSYYKKAEKLLSNL